MTEQKPAPTDASGRALLASRESATYRQTPAPVETGRQQTAEHTTVVSAAVNIVLSIVQIAIGLLAHSQGLIADGIHSLSDLIADAVVFVVNRKSHTGPDEDHQYGHTRYENAASLFLGTLLLVVGAGMLWAGVVKIGHPELIATPHVIALWTALIAILAKEGLFRYMLAAANRIGSRMLVANAWHARSDAASSLVVTLGVAGSLAGYRVLDPVAAMIVGCMIGRMGWHFAWDALQDLMDRALPHTEVERIRATLAATPGVISVHDLRTRRMGDEAIADAHLEVNPRITVSEGHYIAAQARRRVIADNMVRHIQIHIDPRENTPTSDYALPFRDDLITELMQLAPELMASVQQVTLHYLEGYLQIELISSQATEAQALTTLQAALLARYAARVQLILKQQSLSQTSDTQAGTPH